MFFVKQNHEVTGRTSTPGSILIKTTLVKSLQRCCSTPRPCLYQRLEQTIVAGRQNDPQIEVLGAYYTSWKVYGNLVMQAMLLGRRGLSMWLVLCFQYSGRSNPAEEIGFLEVL